MDLLHFAMLVAIVVLFVVVVICVRRINKLVGHIEELGVEVEESLDVIAEAHRNILNTAGQDVVSNEPNVRAIVNTLFGAATAVHRVANKLVSFDKTEALDE